MIWRSHGNVAQDSNILWCHDMLIGSYRCFKWSSGPSSRRSRRFKSSGMWHHVTEWLFTNVLKDSSSFSLDCLTLKMKILQSFKIMAYTHPTTQTITFSNTTVRTSNLTMTDFQGFPQVFHDNVSSVLPFMSSQIHHPHSISNYGETWISCT
jgi:hypothetical protein